jgi:hypothetical protein
MRQRTTKFTAEPSRTSKTLSFPRGQKCIAIVDWRGDVVVNVLNVSLAAARCIAFAANKPSDVFNALDAMKRS